MDPDAVADTLCYKRSMCAGSDIKFTSCKGFLEGSRFALIHSRQMKGTCTDAPWIQMTKRILSMHEPAKETLVTSAGMLHYDVVLREWLHRGGRCDVIVAVPIEKWDRELRRRYAWLENEPGITLREADYSRRNSTVDVLQKNSPVDALRRNSSVVHSRVSRPSAMMARDEAVMAAANVIEAGCINKNGRMAQLLRRAAKNGHRVCYRRMTTDERGLPKKIRYEQWILPETLESFDDYIWHFTRTRCEPWPDETQADYVDDLLGRRLLAPYRAEATLRRIINQRLLHAGTRLIRGSYPVVCFSEASWTVMKRLFTWQPHLRRVRFEPYAVGIRKTCLRELDILPVIYGPVALFGKLPETERWRYQKFDQHAVKWIEEKEWRSKGDVDLMRIHDSDLAVLTPSGIQKLADWQ